MVEVLAVDGQHPGVAALERAGDLLDRGGLLIYPTDTQYALGGRALLPGVALAVRSAKRRDAGKPLPLIAADLAQARGLCARWPGQAERLAERFWPGPLTLVLPVGDGVPFEVSAGAAGLALRVPALELARALCRIAGPLISTSANPAGEPPPVTCGEAVAALGSVVSLALDAGPGFSLASTILDLTGEAPVLLRAGPVAWEDVRRALGLPGPSGS
jgi:L-threonylcarbamoyladenylate synthase